MSKLDIVRAWKDEAYRASLSESDLAQLPVHPAGEIELHDHELAAIVGASTSPSLSAGCCNSESNFTCRDCLTFVSITGCAATFIFNC